MRFSAPEPPLADELVALRPWRHEDAPAIVAAIDGEPAITEWLDMVPQPYGLDDGYEYLAETERGWARGTNATFAVLDALDGRVIGSIGVRFSDPEQAVAEVGYWTASEARGRGIATGALRLVARWLFDVVGVERLQLKTDTLNEPSQRVAEKAGFTREGVLRSLRYNARQGRRVDFVLFSLLPGELAP